MSDDIEARADRLAERIRRNGRFVSLADAVSEATAAEVLGVSPRTLRGWRKAGKGPSCYSTGRVWYSLVELVRYIDSLAGSGR